MFCLQQLVQGYWIRIPAHMVETLSPMLCLSTRCFWVLSTDEQKQQTSSHTSLQITSVVCVNRWFMSPQHVDPAQAVDIHRDIRSKHSIGIHWGTFVLTSEVCWCKLLFISTIANMSLWNSHRWLRGVHTNLVFIGIWANIPACMMWVFEPENKCKFSYFFFFKSVV